jgi:hypothetical protein
VACGTSSCIITAHCQHLSLCSSLQA